MKKDDSYDPGVDLECLCKDPPEVRLPCYVPVSRPCAPPLTRVIQQSTDPNPEARCQEKYSDGFINKCCSFLCLLLIGAIFFAFLKLLDQRFLLHCYECQGPESGPCGHPPRPNTSSFLANRVLCLGKVCVARCEGGRSRIVTRGCEDFEMAVSSNRTALAGNTDLKQAGWCNDIFETGACNAYEDVCKYYRPPGRTRQGKGKGRRRNYTDYSRRGGSQQPWIQQPPPGGNSTRRP
ncbi:unnamed protein product [Bemisia tabaci]|uniref:Uncharacterized protein n=2 Tax=Bemisia tabaci TaxID=7038 RepID=A0A9P0G5Q1_BEMTA|nr:unnamed protein product [Bemisia tabaci]